MTRTRWLLAVLMSSAWLFGVGASPASACSCYGGMDAIAEILSDADSASDSRDLIFYGSVIDSGDSDVTEEWSGGDQPTPGLALLFEVRGVLAGEAGATVAIHTPGGNGSGNCSVGVIAGEQFVHARLNSDGHLTSAMCSIFPGLVGEQIPGPETLFGLGDPPDPDIAADALPEPEVEMDFTPMPVVNEPVSWSQTLLIFGTILPVIALAGYVVVLRRRPKSGS